MGREISIDSVTIGGSNPLAFIAGPCVIENEVSTLRSAARLSDISASLGIQVIFKSSYDKANRTSITSYRGPGMSDGLAILQKVKKETGLPVMSDVHTVEEIAVASEVLDCLQIPAFLCRQTDIIVAAARTGKPLNVKKGQFLAPADVKNIVEKASSAGNEQIMITERGTSFGYNNLVVDMRSIPIIQSFGVPVLFDATHSVQLPGGQGASSGGEREFIQPLARAAVAAGCDALFTEVHESPDTALCDGPTMLPIDDFALLAKKLIELHTIVKR